MKLKILTKEKYSIDIISEWLQPKGYELSIVCIKDPALNLALNLTFGKYDEFKRFLSNEYKQDTESEDCIAMCVQFKHEKKTWNYLLIQENEWTAEHYGTICHELHHFTHFALTEKGIHYGEAGEEVYAYTQGFFMEMVVRAFVQFKKVKTYRKNK